MTVTTVMEAKSVGAAYGRQEALAQVSPWAARGTVALVAAKWELWEPVKELAGRVKEELKATYALFTDGDNRSAKTMIVGVHDCLLRVLVVPIGLLFGCVAVVHQVAAGLLSPAVGAFEIAPNTVGPTWREGKAGVKRPQLADQDAGLMKDAAEWAFGRQLGAANEGRTLVARAYVPLTALLTLGQGLVSVAGKAVAEVAAVVQEIGLLILGQSSLKACLKVVEECIWTATECSLDLIQGTALFVHDLVAGLINPAVRPTKEKGTTWLAAEELKAQCQMQTAHAERKKQRAVHEQVMVQIVALVAGSLGAIPRGVDQTVAQSMARARQAGVASVQGIARALAVKFHRGPSDELIEKIATELKKLVTSSPAQQGDV